MSEVLTAIIVGIVVASFTALLGYVLGNRATQQLKIDIAAIAPAIAGINQTIKALQVAIDSVAHGFIEHTRQPGHLGGMERLRHAEEDLVEVTKQLRDHVSDYNLHQVERRHG